ncbi:Pectin acetylesterase [Rhynchospora pubera]|uniref:Pectin acetylesterase n=1 Tax=Rhynchospora pubera TaxID=906938 RepID=A0AAV8CX78_9POAL|nr:Pectin acetylesterase [Rhynchospora pubera]
MDYCLERRPPPLVGPRRSSHPSFSASLLDAIYRSLDGNTSETERTSTRHSKPRPQPDPMPPKKKSNSDFWWASTKRKPTTPSYTSSDTSSYGFSSDAEPPQTKPAKVNRVQFNPPTLPPKTPPQEKKKKPNLFHKRWRELRKGRICVYSSSNTGTSTRAAGSPLSNFLKAFFSSSRTQKKKKNILGMAAPQQVVDVPVLVPVPPPEERNINAYMEAEAVKQRVEEILRDLEKEEEKEEEEDDSDASSDLFELENLTEIGSDELPVYCTTSLVANHPAVVANKLAV